MNKKIRNATECKSDNITFKSQLEKSVYNTLLEQGFKPQYEPRTFELWESFMPITPFYDKETDSQFKKRIKEMKGEKGSKGEKESKSEKANSTSRRKLLVLKNSKITGIRYTPDFYFRYENVDVYIEAKGMENDVFYIKKKLFRKYLDKHLFDTGQHSLYFEIYTKAQLLQAINILKEYVDNLCKEKV